MVGDLDTGIVHLPELYITKKQLKDIYEMHFGGSENEPSDLFTRDELIKETNNMKTIKDIVQEAVNHEKKANKIKSIAKKADIDISKYDIDELVMGYDVEKEHGTVNPETNVTDDDPVMTLKIALAHLNEIPDYYAKLKKYVEDGGENLDEGKKGKVNPWAVCTSSVGRSDKDKYERCVMSVKKKQGMHQESEEINEKSISKKYKPLSNDYDISVDNMLDITSDKDKNGFKVKVATFYNTKGKKVNKKILSKGDLQIFSMKDGLFILEVDNLGEVEYYYSNNLEDLVGTKQETSPEKKNVIKEGVEAQSQSIKNRLIIKNSVDNMSPDKIRDAKKFIALCLKELGIKEPVTIYFTGKRGGPIKTTASFFPDNNEIWIYCKNRNMLGDILRSTAHEIRHLKQNLDGVITDESGKDGSEHENEANSFSGLMIRKFGKICPSIYQ